MGWIPCSGNSSTKKKIKKQAKKMEVQTSMIDQIKANPGTDTVIHACKNENHRNSKGFIMIVRPF